MSENKRPKVDIPTTDYEALARLAQDINAPTTAAALARKIIHDFIAAQDAAQPAKECDK